MDAPSRPRFGRSVLLWLAAAGVLVRGHRIIGACPGKLDAWTR
ncbi:hypothetical protein ACFORH_05265 [Amycolatopsis roodepoortensis]|uniref:Uncharacterized protein n=1 Tax=Amycolatopsis roodepoortensis TaxID=700274 RepID=A0ABR9L8C9_9PSEU|nr:hypothetical protein [Amycolatopsis roodepoortensis]MBE1576416.1 hypothetical protein [Amycolatopsis roodepoortensis]